MSFTRTAARADAGRVGAGRCCGVRGVCGALPGRSGGGRGDGISADARRTGDRGGVDGFSMSRSPRGDADCCSRDGGPGLCGARKLSASSARRMPSSTGTAAIWLFVDSQGFRHMASTVRAGWSGPQFAPRARSRSRLFALSARRTTTGPVETHRGRTAGIQPPLASTDGSAHTQGAFSPRGERHNCYF